MNESDLSPRRKIFGRLSIVAGNSVQIAGLVAAYLSLSAARSAHSIAAAVAAMVVGWVLLYFCCHAIAHWVGVQTEKASMQKATPIARAIMWSAGVTSSAVVPSLGAFWAWRSGVPGSKLFLLFALFWAAGTLASNWTSRAGDYAKARRALGNI